MPRWRRRRFQRMRRAARSALPVTTHLDAISDPPEHTPAPSKTRVVHTSMTSALVSATAAERHRKESAPKQAPATDKVHKAAARKGRKTPAATS